jgi:hypothetical protein
VTLRHGALLAPRPPTVKRLTAGAPQAPLTNWLTRFKADGDPLGNDQYGCCVDAADIQIMRLWGARCDTSIVLNRYRQTGWNPATGVPDNGTPTSADMLNWVAAPVLDLDLKPWASAWATADHTDDDEIRSALARFPLRITIGLPASIAQFPERWCQAPDPSWTPDEAHEVVLGFADASGWWVRTWGLDYAVSPAMMKLMLLAVDVPIPHPSTVPPELQLAGEDFSRYGVLA